MDIPNNWGKITVADAFYIETGSTPSTTVDDYWKNGTIKWITPKDLGKIKTIWIDDTERKITHKALEACPIRRIPPESIIISTRAPIGYIAITRDFMAFNQGCKGLVKISKDIFIPFFYFVLLTKVGEMNYLGSGSTFKEISKSQISNLQIPLPPLPEQHRIVAKIEELFTRLDAGGAALTKAKALLKQYRQAVLKAAVEGKLTEEWRKEHAGEIEPASVLLERIQAERRQRLGKNYKPPRPIDTSNLPELPEGWAWTELINAAMLHRGYDLPVQNRINGIYPVVASSSIVGYHNKKMIDGPGVITGRSGTIGEVIYIDSDYWPLNTTLYVCDFNGNLPRFIYYLLKSIRLQKYLAGTGVPTLNRNIVHPTLVPLPPVSEQVIIANFLANYFSIIDESEQIIDAELKRSQSLRQSILKRAFAGKLVPQDPADEPASVLLEKIRKEKEVV